MLLTRRRLQVALGLLWLLDAALQLQPVMFTSVLARQVIAPTAAGQPGPVAALVHLTAHAVAWHPVLANAAFAAVQLLLAAGLLHRRTARLALALSVPWALGIWAGGEGLGGLLGGADVVAGAPGAALLYAVLAAAAWPSREHPAEEAPAAWTSLAWTATWLALAVAGLARSGAGPLLGAAGLCLALLVYAGRTGRRLAAAGGGLLALLVWALSQDFGGLASGQATDPGTGPLLLLLAAATLAAPPLSRQRRAVLPYPEPARVSEAQLAA